MRKGVAQPDAPHSSQGMNVMKRVRKRVLCLRRVSRVGWRLTVSSGQCHQTAGINTKQTDFGWGGRSSATGANERRVSHRGGEQGGRRWRRQR